ncbi:hypothetical protein HNP52_000145 [Sphingomonas kyeonggiensis]|uniref:Lipoprotein n=1 Tax=Sphingomonas kyeonggiensis TaxID=1268553 RepID=A0A7W7NQZ8_9SPHN|nr:hypothetical protein [Sphingomonas kyeonggiensis]MBB4837094.1 hypothetical protein [Sphingomonas kyeonggiensis]
MAKRLALIGFLAAISMAPAAHACSVIVDHEPTSAELFSTAKQMVAAAEVILDGEVVEAGVDGGAPAKIRVHRILKGQVSDTVYIHGDSGACFLNFGDIGERRRFILSRNSGQFVVWDRPWADRYDRPIDRVLKSDRRKDWPRNRR